jgi:general secretion pathway protein A
LCSTRLDSHILLTVVLAGDKRLLERLRSDEFLPLASRMRVRLAIERATPDELQEYLKQALHRQIDEKLFLETCSPPAAETRTATGRRR